MSEAPHTLVVGATTNPERYAYLAIQRLLNAGQEVYALGVKEGTVLNVPIQTGFPELENVHTVTLYINPKRQPQYYDYLLKLKPKRIIFNPGTENEEFEAMARAQGVEVLEACTLVMLSTDQY